MCVAPNNERDPAKNKASIIVGCMCMYHNDPGYKGCTARPSLHNKKSMQRHVFGITFSHVDYP